MSKQEELSVTEKFTKQIKNILVHYHSDQKAMAVQRGMLNRAKSGYAVTRPPLGYSKTETSGLFKINCQGLFLRKYLKLLVNGKAESKYLPFDLMFVLRDHDGQLKLWNTARVKRLLTDPYYIGYISHKGQLYSGLHEPLITEKEQKKLLALLKKHEDNNSLKSVDKSL